MSGRALNTEFIERANGMIGHEISHEEEPDGKRRYVPRIRGRRSRMGVYEYWVYLFERNEICEEKMSDGDISRDFCAEFPDIRTAWQLRSGKLKVNTMRNKYMQGRLGFEPRFFSHRYDSSGARLPVKRVPAGSLVAPEHTPTRPREIETER